MIGIKLSRQFFDQVLLPVVQRGRPGFIEAMSCGVFGGGSDAAGLDDEISRDHHWGPRVQILLPADLDEQEGADFRAWLRGALPADYHGFPVRLDPHAIGGVSVESIDRYFTRFTGYARAPTRLVDWFDCTEADLFHATNGVVWHDPAGELAHRRAGFAYWPEPLWKKKIADWAMFLTGRDAAYNVNRCCRRGDRASACIFLGQSIKRAMELGFLLNRTYAPYTKWLHRLFVRLPRLADEVDPHLQQALHAADWDEKVMALTSICRVYARDIHAMGLTEVPSFLPFDPTLTDLVLYESTAMLLQQVPEELVHGKFNETESWERVARASVLDPDDYVQQRIRAHRAGNAAGHPGDEEA